jgi:hypothetical protein
MTNNKYALFQTSSLFVSLDKGELVFTFKEMSYLLMLMF